MKVAVLGGGPAGLYAALGLARRGVDVTVLEREAFPGGLAAGLAIDGVSVDLGSHRLHPSIEPPILADLRSLLGEELGVRSRNGRIGLAGTWLSFPLKPSEILTRLPPSVVVRLSLGAIAALAKPERSHTFADVVSTGLGRPMGDLFYFPYAVKIWGVEAASLSGEQARRRISADSPLKLARKLLSSSEGRHFYYPSAGFGRIPAAIAEAAVAAGASLRFESSVTEMRPRSRGTGWEIEAGGQKVSADLVLSTVPVALLARMLTPPADVARAASSLASRSMVLVYFTVPAARWTNYDAHYFPDASVPFTRISEPKNYRDSDSDPTDRTVICVEVPCGRDDEVWSASDEALATDLRAAIIAQGLPDPGAVVAVRRLRSAYPVYHVGVEKDFAVVDRWLSAQDGLLTFGRQGLFAHDNTHHALAMARDAVSVISDDGVIDRNEWGRARTRFGDHVVED